MKNRSIRNCQCYDGHHYNKLFELSNCVSLGEDIYELELQHLGEVMEGSTWIRNGYEQTPGHQVDLDLNEKISMI